MKNFNSQLWQSTLDQHAHRSVMPTGASVLGGTAVAARTRSFGAATAAGAFAGIVCAAAAAAKPCADATVVAAHRGPDAWSPPIC